MFEKIEIKKGIPVPNPLGRNSRFANFPYGDMEVGDCFDVPVREGQTVRNVRTSLAANARAWAVRHHPTRKFVTREVVDGDKLVARIWRWC